MADLGPRIAQLREASRQTVRQLGLLRPDYSETGCSHSQCHVLMELDFGGKLTVGDLAEILCQDKSTTSRAVGPLIRRKLVRSTVDRRDARCRHLSLTAAGRRQVARIHEMANRQVSEALALLDEKQIETVVEGMTVYARALERRRRLADVVIRPIARADDEVMGQVIRRVMTEFGAVGCGFSIEDPEVDHMSRAYAGKRATYFVAKRDGVLLGGSGVAPLDGSDDPDLCELRKMYVLPEGRGLGLGRRLMDLCLEAARRRGFKRVYLETLDSMAQARHLYDKYGFAPLDRPLGNTGHGGCNRWAVREL